MRQPFTKAATTIDTFEQLVGINGPWLTVFEVPHDDNTPPSYISLMGQFGAQNGQGDLIVAKEHDGYESMMMQTAGFRNGKSPSGAPATMPVILSPAALTAIMTSASLPSFVNPEKVPEDMFPIFTDTRMALAALAEKIGVKPRL